jgi:hypothetical protein
MSEPQLISGKWYNQLGSRLDLHIDDTGLISGFFRSSVGEIEGRHPITGYFDPTPDNRRGALGIAVSWHPAHAVTVWSGHYEADSESIVATWLLTGGPFGELEWRSTLIGHDIFSRELVPVAETAGLPSPVPPRSTTTEE